MKYGITGGALTACLLIAACTQAPDLRAVEAQRQQPIQRYDNFLAVASNTKTLASAGGAGVLVTSNDGGAKWLRQKLPSAASIVAMASCPDGTFAALDFYRKVWLGNADGSEWSAKPLEGDFSPIAIDCDAQNRLWVAGTFSTVLSSADHGASWTSQALGEDAILTAIRFVDEQHGFIAGEFGTLLVTEDGGASWNRREGLPAEFYPYSMVFADLTHGWVSGLAGSILQTTDGGQTWAQQENPAAAPLYALFMAGTEVLGVGDGGLVMSLQPTGWQVLSDTPKVPSFLAAGAALQPRTVLVAGAAGALKVVELPERVAVAASASSLSAR